ncbi:probable tubulin polyglutamylase TTLL9 isoform X2 [Eublepharis macularius]|uniref:Tubulin--tyrosine ligase-like protein 9 n=1 Tax=Eublepharis macularius TaxID=481883 RepID=A0AA97KZ46_EUBMA|nr:probable tubulin polyglutamylase TTLL9 isoform X2 [Eublepharis macularius]
MAKNKNISYKGPYGYQKLKEREGRACIRFKCALTNTILDVLRQRPGWVEVKEEGDWDFYWCDVRWLQENFDHTYMDDHVRISHFRNHYELTRKNYIVKNLKRFRKQLERDSGKLEATKCDFFPKTFEMPSEYHLFVEEFRKNPGITWIMKPVARSQGRGIFLFRKLKDVIDWRKVRCLHLLTSQPTLKLCWDGVRLDDQKDEIPVENYVAQRYIENPYLIGGRKFDLRVYVLVMSYLPLKAWLYRDGFARFSNTRFTLNTIDDHYVHLTNVAVQKTAPDYDPEKGCKWMIQQFRLYLTAKHGAEAVEGLFAEMDNIFIKTLQSVQKVIISDKHCFELYGYDILIDQDLKPWLLEVNASPSLTASSQEDYELKTHLLEDTLNIVDMEGRLTGKEKRVGGFDLIWNDGPISREDGNLDTPMNGFVANTHLGYNNDRKKQLKRLYKSIQTPQKV